jgi:elongation factor G
VDKIKGGAIPKQFISAVEKGFRQMLEKGTLIGHPVVNVRVLVDDGNSHAVDSSDTAFTEAAKGAWRDTFPRSSPKILEPIMKVTLEGPPEHQGNMITTLMQRRGMIVGTTEDEGLTRVNAEVPLAEMFGYATALRSSTQGKAEFTMEFSRYLPVPDSVGEELLAEAAEKRKAQGK